MLGSSHVLKGNLGFQVQGRRGAGIGVDGLRDSSSVLISNLKFVKKNNKGSRCKLNSGSIAMGAGLARMGVDHVLTSSANFRSVKAQAASEFSGLSPLTLIIFVLFLVL